MAKGENAEEEEVSGEQQVDVLLGEHLEEDVDAKQSGGGYQREGHGVPTCHGFWLFTRFLKTKTHCDHLENLHQF